MQLNRFLARQSHLGLVIAQPYLSATYVIFLLHTRHCYFRRKDSRVQENFASTHEFVQQSSLLVASHLERQVKSNMATLLPPPKRQKSAYSQSLKPKELTPPPEPVPSVVVQFKSAEDGSNLGPAINLPADTGRDALQMLVNKLRGEVCL